MAVEQFTQNGICIMRRFKTIDQVGRQSIWQVEIGESPEDEQERQRKICDEFTLSTDQPEIIRLDSPQYFVFKITNIKYPASNYEIECQDNDIIIRSKNKTFYKKIQITDMIWQQLKLQNSQLQYLVKDQQLIIIYIKPQIIKDFERAAIIKRQEEC